MHLAFSSMNTHKDPPPPELAVALEERGFESLWYVEHSHIPCSRKTPYPPGGEMPAPYREMMDPYLSLMAAAAATTSASRKWLSTLLREFARPCPLRFLSP